MDKKDGEDEGGSCPTSPSLQTLKTFERTLTASSNESIQQWIDSLNECDWHEFLEGQPESLRETDTPTYHSVNFLTIPCVEEDDLHLGADARSISCEGSERSFAISPRLSPLPNESTELSTPFFNPNGKVEVDNQLEEDRNDSKEENKSKKKEQHLENSTADGKMKWMYENRQNSMSSIQSVSSLLAATGMDPEEMLISLGFGEEFASPYHQIPTRFFINPSRAKGIDVDDFCSKFINADQTKTSELESTRINVLGRRFTRSSIDLTSVTPDDGLLAKMKRLKFRQSSVPSITVVDDSDDRDGSSSDKASGTRQAGNLRLSTVVEEYEPSSRKSSFSRSFSKEKKKLPKQERFDMMENAQETVAIIVNGSSEERIPGKGASNLASLDEGDDIFGPVINANGTADISAGPDAPVVQVINVPQQRSEVLEKMAARDDLPKESRLEIRAEVIIGHCRGQSSEAEQNENYVEAQQTSETYSCKGVLDNETKKHLDKNNNNGFENLKQAEFENTPKTFDKPSSFENHKGSVALRVLLYAEKEDDLEFGKAAQRNENDVHQWVEEEKTGDDKMQRLEGTPDEGQPGNVDTVSHHSFPDSIEGPVQEPLSACKQVLCHDEQCFSDDSLEDSVKGELFGSEYDKDSIEHGRDRREHEKESNCSGPPSPSRIVYRSLGKVEHLIESGHVDTLERESSVLKGLGESLKLRGDAILENIPFLSRGRTASRESDTARKVSAESDSSILGCSSPGSARKPSRLRNYLSKLASGKIRSFISLESLNVSDKLSEEPLSRTRENLSKSHENLSKSSGHSSKSSGHLSKQHENLSKSHDNFLRVQDLPNKSQKLSHSCAGDNFDQKRTSRSRRATKLRNLTKPEDSGRELQVSELNDCNFKTESVVFRSPKSLAGKSLTNGTDRLWGETSPKQYCNDSKTKNCYSSYTNGNHEGSIKEGRVTRAKAMALSKGLSIESSGFEDENDISKSAATREFFENECGRICLGCVERRISGTASETSPGSCSSITGKSGPRSSTPTESMVNPDQFEYLVGQVSSLRKEVKDQEERFKAYIDESMERIRSSILTEMSILNASLKTRSPDTSLNYDINGRDSTKGN